ncbi:MAG: DsrE/DsrF-like family protein [Methanoregula sp. PtaU1.Bin006]|uniref:DsrE family protein n=1 Tax=Methanoregula sp. PtaU1.Bin006 TaxID=1811681 RepID=UPI0009D5FEAB|nr:DsrE family protein [Methanoregula sp. PtaU1.Bin006]OPY32758.1 MAG: DsrE/DsrF-like family protein [Methanoregula sp. PtaU1.Bin006]
MTSHFFLLGSPLSAERLSWIEESLKFYFVKLNPENLLHHTKTPRDAVFVFLMTGEALYSLQDPHTLPVWEILLSMPSVKIICDLKELELRGISIARLKMKVPDQIIDSNSLALNGNPSFWKDVMKYARQHEQPVPSTVGYLQMESPYMNRSSHAALQYLAAGVEAHASVEFYTYLDGVHCGHTGQNPSECENIGKGLEDLQERALKKGLAFQMLACGRCSAARGYSTWDDGKGVVISTCTIKPVKIRNLNEIIGQFSRQHIILAKDSGSLHFQKEGLASSFPLQDTERSPPVNIFVTCRPYGTEVAFGAVSFAVACAYGGIQTRVIFIEDGIYALTGDHKLDKESHFFNLQEVIDAVAGSANLQFFAYQPSFSQRGLMKNKKLNAVLDIGIPELGQLLFYPPNGVSAGHQRIFFF